MYINSQTIKALRKDRAWTQQQLADICGLSMRTIQRVERQSIGSLETSKALAGAFDVKRDLLLEEQLTSSEPQNKGAGMMIKLATSFALGMASGAAILFVSLYAKVQLFN
jgi:transcriptional regulator with XRE-family HTH domain